MFKAKFIKDLWAENWICVRCWVLFGIDVDWFLRWARRVDRRRVFEGYREVGVENVWIQTNFDRRRFWPAHYCGERTRLKGQVVTCLAFNSKNERRCVASGMLVFNLDSKQASNCWFESHLVLPQQKALCNIWTIPYCDVSKELWVVAICFRKIPLP